jgi:homogentisate phytyltransferase / homogentisate geranylgeranyltransferase
MIQESRTVHLSAGYSFTKKLRVLWQFSRPHTIVGSVFSITALYILACHSAAVSITGYGFLYMLTLISALGCNVFIVGLNQWVDVELDKINKPWLPLAAGTLTRNKARIIMGVALVVCMVFAGLASLFLLGLMAVILLIGIAYSVPPLQLKKHHLPAALAITAVRGFIVNLGMFIHFRLGISNNGELTGMLWLLTIFTVVFSVAIAWFKDLPDTEGDSRFRVHTLAVLYSRKLAFRAGIGLVALAYLFVLWRAWIYLHENRFFFILAHGILLLLFLGNTIFVKLDNTQSIKAFYLRFWFFFFAEYTVFAVWALV